MSFFGYKSKTPPLVWNKLESLSQLDEIEQESVDIPVLILKHSTRCSISAMAKNRLELYWDPEVRIKPYYLDLLSYRTISDEIATRYKVVHQSPQVLLFKNGHCFFDASHNEIDYNKIKSLL